MTKFDLSLCFALPHEAAAEIERLTAENEKLRAAISKAIRGFAALKLAGDTEDLLGLSAAARRNIDSLNAACQQLIPHSEEGK